MPYPLLYSICFLICLVVFNAGPYSIFKYVVQMCKKSIYTPLAVSHMDVSENVPDIQLIVCFYLLHPFLWKQGTRYKRTTRLAHSTCKNHIARLPGIL